MSLSSGFGAKRQKTKKAVRQLDGLLFQGRIVPTESKKDHQNFLAKSYWAAKGSVKEFFQNKHICFQQLNNVINICVQMTKNVTFARCNSGKHFTFQLLKLSL
jgi:hypothetical protein